MKRIAVLAGIILGGLSSSGVAQEAKGTITGNVRHQTTQEPLIGANVLVVTTSRGTSTDAEGNFTIRELPVGSYQLRVSAVGYQPIVQSDVVVAAGRAVNVVINLEESTIGLDEVEVTASYFRKSPDATISIQRLSYEEIRRSPGGFEDVVRAISVLPGVAQAQPGRNDLVVRGGAPSENLFVVDNIEIPNINHFGTQGASGGPLSYINLDFVRETSFSTGGFGVRYGDRMSSVLTIDLQDGRDDRIGGKATVSASQFGLNLQGPISDNGSFVFSARRSYLDLIFKAAGFSFVPEYWDFLARASYKVDNTNKVTFFGVGAIDNVSFFNDNADNRFDNSRVLGTAQKQYASGLTWQHLFSAGYTTLTLGRSFVTYNGVQRDSLLHPIFTNRSEEGETSLGADVVLHPWQGGDLSFGLQGRLIKFKANLALPNYVSTFGDTLDINIQDFKETGSKASAYVQLSQRMFERFQFTIGGRTDYFSLIDKKFSFAPRASLSFDVTPLTTVTASAGVYYQSPSYIWLVANPSNRTLNAARAIQYILGVEQLLQADLKLRVEAFQKVYGDYPVSLDRPYLVLANTGGGFGGTQENFASFGLERLGSAGSGVSRGLEILMQKKLSPFPLYGLVSLTFSDARFKALDGIERSGAFDQRLILTTSAGYQFDERWEASMKFRYSSGQPYTPFNPDGTQNVAAYNAERVKAAHSLDVRVDRRWNFAQWNLIVYLDIQNIYNNKFSGDVRWNARERRAETNENAIGILPSIGVSAEF